MCYNGAIKQITISALKKIWQEPIHHWEHFFVWVAILALPVCTIVIARGAHEFTHRVIIGGKIIAAEKSFKFEMQRSLDRTRQISQNPDIQDAIRDNDGPRAVAGLRTMTKDLGLSSAVAVNAQGVAIARIPSPRTGDFVFQTTPWGQYAQRGQEIILVDAGRNYPLIISSAIPYIMNGAVTGALFGGHILDDLYAARFQHEYLAENEQVAFYALATGVYGVSFRDPTAEHLFKLAFNEGSDAVQQSDAGLIAGHFQVGSITYHIGNIKFTNQNGDIVGGMFVLIPTNNKIPLLIGGGLGILLVIFLTIHIRKKHKNRLYRIAVPVGASVLVLGGMLLSIRLINARFFIIQPSMQSIYNSTIQFSPDADVLSMTTSHRIGIKISTSGEAINVVRASIVYDPKKLRIEDIVMDDSFCDQAFIIEKNIDNIAGTVGITCGKAAGFSDATATLADLIVQPLHAGEATLTFATDTAVLAHDGLGTNVLRTVTNGAYQFIAQAERGVLFSPSHPNPTRWYNTPNVDITWTAPPGYTTATYLIDHYPDTIPNLHNPILLQNDLAVRVPGEGIYYIHVLPLRAGSSGQTKNLKILVDTTPPRLPHIRASATRATVGDVIRLEFFDSGDGLSGLQKNYYVRFDRGTWFPTLAQLSIPFLSSGIHEVSLRVFDNAGNYSDASIEITIDD